jgi:hypothetical protein
MEQRITPEKVGERARMVLEQYLAPSLASPVASRIAYEYEMLTREKDGANEENQLGATTTYVVKHSGSPVYCLEKTHDNEYQDESPAHRQAQTVPNAFVPIGEVRRMLRQRRGYIRENTETCRCRLYDPTGTFVGNVSEETKTRLELGDEITRRHEDDTYDTHWAREGNGDGAGAT